MSLDATACMALASADAVEEPFFTAERVLPWIEDAHRDSEKRFIAPSDEKLTVFVELDCLGGCVWLTH
jgi:hypothetical protein